jgi:hypothetical protein
MEKFLRQFLYLEDSGGHNILILYISYSYIFRALTFFKNLK